MTNCTQLTILSFCLMVGTQFQIANGQDESELWAAARQGDLEKAKSLIASGISVDAKTDYGATALSFASDRGHVAVVEFLLSKKATPNVKDTFYNATPMSWATMGKHTEIMKLLAIAGADDIAVTFNQAIAKKDIEFVKQILKRDHISRSLLKTNLKRATADGQKEIATLLTEKLETTQPKIAIKKATLDAYKECTLTTKEPT